MKHPILLAAFVACSAVSTAILASDSRAQTAQEKKLDFPAASPAASVKQRIGLSDVELEYSRPSMKGRKIYGGLVPYGEVWRTGANGATKIKFSGDVKFGGEAVPAGEYALFTLPTAAEWTVILNKVPGQWGAYNYDAKNDLVRVNVKPLAHAEAVETMSIGFIDVRDDSAVLAIDWDKTRVGVKIEVDLVATLVPQIKAAMAAEGKKPYLAAAMFYYEHNLDLKQAAAWMDEAAKEQPTAVWIVYRKGLVLAKLGDKRGAMDAALRTLEMAEKQGGALGTEYKHLGEALIASLD